MAAPRSLRKTSAVRRVHFIKKSSKPKEKMAEVLNLNNEVVMMRKEVKKARALIIRKLTRQITKLKKKKGKEVELEKNQRRAARLLEEIHEMKTLKPDHVTKAALMKNLSFEKVCKNPNSTLSERATVRIATHPQISKRILEIKAAIKAFKEERRKPAEGKASKPVKPVENPDMDAGSGDNNNDHGDDDDGDDQAVMIAGDCSDDNADEVEEKEERVGPNKDHSSPVKDGLADRTTDDIKVTAPKAELKVPSEETTEVVVQPEEKPETLTNQKSLCSAHTLESSQTLPTKDKRKQKPTENKTTLQNWSDSRVEIKGHGGQEEEEKKEEEEEEQKKKKIEEEEEESDLEPSDEEEEKEYFDDSTEERFRKQSSQSEDSGEDDFFLGKVSKFKKKKSEPSKGDEKKNNRDRSGDVENKPMVKSQGQGKQDSKAVKLESIFCNALSGSRVAPGNRGSGPSGFGKPHRFQNDRKGFSGTQNPGRFQNRGDGYDRKPMPSKFQNQNLRGGSRPQDRGQAATRGRPQFEKHRASAGRAPNPSQHAQQALHPSWEASKRRKEQQAQITVFQGKKIKFDDD
ncbi:hypothetical protein AAFF_G00034740 [Aldrovandia affinis]|uniref:Serum response factor-binding protein 1 n=1 Tax=Aldrovandia affinis TaxID=143900 RepID=A0AAD7S3T4_9TELE|nr:hypothetical protein AAFF_G00034740 [Aldrovandia affinis]